MGRRGFFWDHRWRMKGKEMAKMGMGEAARDARREAGGGERGWMAAGEGSGTGQREEGEGRGRRWGVYLGGGGCGCRDLQCE